MTSRGPCCSGSSVKSKPHVLTHASVSADASPPCRHVRALARARQVSLSQLIMEWLQVMRAVNPLCPYLKHVPPVNYVDAPTLAYATLLLECGLNSSTITLADQLQDDRLCCNKVTWVNTELLYTLTGETLKQTNQRDPQSPPVHPQFYRMTPEERFSILSKMYKRPQPKVTRPNPSSKRAIPKFSTPLTPPPSTSQSVTSSVSGSESNLVTSSSPQSHLLDYSVQVGDTACVKKEDASSQAYAPSLVSLATQCEMTLYSEMQLVRDQPETADFDSNMGACDMTVATVESLLTQSGLSGVLPSHFISYCTTLAPILSSMRKALQIALTAIKDPIPGESAQHTTSVLPLSPSEVKAQQEMDQVSCAVQDGSQRRGSLSEIQQIALDSNSATLRLREEVLEGLQSIMKNLTACNIFCTSTAFKEQQGFHILLDPLLRGDINSTGKSVRGSVEEPSGLTTQAEQKAVGPGLAVSVDQMREALECWKSMMNLSDQTLARRSDPASCNNSTSSRLRGNAQVVRPKGGPNRLLMPLTSLVARTQSLMQQAVHELNEWTSAITDKDSFSVHSTPAYVMGCASPAASLSAAPAAAAASNLELASSASSGPFLVQAKLMRAVGTVQGLEALVSSLVDIISTGVRALQLHPIAALRNGRAAIMASDLLDSLLLSSTLDDFPGQGILNHLQAFFRSLLDREQGSWRDPQNHYWEMLAQLHACCSAQVLPLQGLMEMLSKHRMPVEDDRGDGHTCLVSIVGIIVNTLCTLVSGLQKLADESIELTAYGEVTVNGPVSVAHNDRTVHSKYGEECSSVPNLQGEAHEDVLQNVEVESIPPLSTTGRSLKQGSTMASVGQPHYGMSQGAAAPLIQGFFMLLNMLVTSRLALIERMWACVCESASAELESTSSIQPPSYSDVRCALSESQQDVETIQDEVRRLQELLKETTDALQAQQQLHQQVPLHAHLCNTITDDASGHVTQLDQLPLTSAEGRVPNMQMHCDGGVTSPSNPGHDSVGIDPLSDPGLSNGERAPSSGHHSDGTTPSSPDHKSGGSESSGPGHDSGETAPSSEPGHDSGETAPSSEPGPVRDYHEADSSEDCKEGMSSTITDDMTSTLPQTAHLNMLSPFYLPAQAPTHGSMTPGSRAQLYSSSFASRSADKLATAVAVATTPGVQRHVEIEVQSNLSNSEPSILTEKDSVNLNNWEHLAFTELQANVTKSLSQALKMIEDINSDGPQLEDITFASFDPAHLVKLHNLNDRPSEEDIKNYARYLGMDPEADSDLLYIAERACTAPVPDGWTVQLDNEGVEYFHSTIQNTSTYHHPRDEFYKKMYCDIKARKNLDTLLTPIQRASMGLSRSSISPLN